MDSVWFYLESVGYSQPIEVIGPWSGRSSLSLNTYWVQVPGSGNGFNPLCQLSTCLFALLPNPHVLRNDSCCLWMFVDSPYVLLLDIRLQGINSQIVNTVEIRFASYNIGYERRCGTGDPFIQFHLLHYLALPYGSKSLP